MSAFFLKIQSLCYWVKMAIRGWTLIILDQPKAKLIDKTCKLAKRAQSFEPRRFVLHEPGVLD
jgi:hypothetical protein